MRATSSSSLTVSVLDDADQDRAPAVFANDVLLHVPAIADVSDILEEDGRPAACGRGWFREFDRNVVEIINRHRQRIGPDIVHFVANLRRAGRQSQGLSVDRIHDI